MLVPLVYFTSLCIPLYTASEMTVWYGCSLTLHIFAAQSIYRLNLTKEVFEVSRLKFRLPQEVGKLRRVGLRIGFECAHVRARGLRG